MSGMIADDRKNLGHVGKIVVRRRISRPPEINLRSQARKIETLSIFPIRPRPSQIIGDVYDLWFS